MMNGDITLEATLWRQRTSKTILPFIISTVGWAVLLLATEHGTMDLTINLANVE